METEQTDWRTDSRLIRNVLAMAIPDTCKLSHGRGLLSSWLMLESRISMIMKQLQSLW